MAETTVELTTRDDKIAQAKEYYAHGSRNYAVKDYSVAADDFSRACELYAELYGEDADELGLPHLYYAKALIALAQLGENKVLALQNEEEQGDGDEDVDDDGGDDDSGEEEMEGVENDKVTDNNEVVDKEQAAEKPEDSKNKESSNVAGGSSSNVSVEDPQPGTSSSHTNGNANCAAELADIPEEEDDDATNLQYAWEALEIAVKIFERMGERGLANLAEAYFELAEISLENDHCTEAIKDYERSCEIYLKLPDDNLRIIAETKYKIGLCYLSMCKFDESMAALKDSADYLNGVIEAEKRKEQTKETEATINEIEETRQEIANKIAEVQEAKEQSLDEVKRQIAKFMNPIPESSSSNGAGCSSTTGGISSSSCSGGGTKTEADKPKASDISHLIKRKKPSDTPTDITDVASPAKKPAV